MNEEFLRDYQDEEVPTCPICIDVLINREEEAANQQAIKKLSCNHIFHKTCIQAWVRIHNNCPLCRTRVDFGA